MADAKVLLPAQTLDKVRVAVTNLQPPSAAAADAEVQARNSKLLKHAAMVLGIAMAAIAVAVTAAYFGMRGTVKRYQPSKARPGAGYPDMTMVMLVSVCSLAAAAVAEFAFLLTVAARYQPLDNNSAKRAIVDQLLAIAGQTPEPVPVPVPAPA